MSRFKVITGLTSYLLIISTSVQAEYKPKEMFVIGWGDSLNQFKAHPAHLEGIRSDSTEWDYYPGDGPSDAFVDDNENVLINSREFGQFKLFDAKGKLILDKSQFEGMSPMVQPKRFYIDKFSNIYLTYEPSVDFVPVYSFKGKMIDVFYPFSQSMIRITDLKWDGCTETFFERDNSGNYVVLNENRFRRVDFIQQLKRNGYYYDIEDCSETRPDEIKFVKIFANQRMNPLVSGETTYVKTPSDSLDFIDLLTGGDDSKLYVYAVCVNDNSELIIVYDLNYHFVSKLALPIPCEKYDFRVYPFVDCKGRIYEFRVLEDGLHVVRWEKK